MIIKIHTSVVPVLKMHLRLNFQFILPHVQHVLNSLIKSQVPRDQCAFTCHLRRMTVFPWCIGTSNLVLDYVIDTIYITTEISIT